MRVPFWPFFLAALAVMGCAFGVMLLTSISTMLAPDPVVFSEHHRGLAVLAPLGFAVLAWRAVNALLAWHERRRR